MNLKQKHLPYLIVALAAFCTCFSCKKTETPPYTPLSAYYPLQTGSTFIYRLDSTLPANFGSALQTVSHTLKDSIVSTFNDNAGRLSYLVYRFITDTLQLQPWQYISTWYITPTATTVEVMDDNNLRFIKLAAPVTDGYSWPGNSYIDIQSQYDNLYYLLGWTYVYENVNMPDTVMKGVIDSTVTVLQTDQTYPEAFSDTDSYYERDYSVEVYAKNIGLIYKNFLHLNWGIQTPGDPLSYSEDSYGFEISLISYK